MRTHFVMCANTHFSHSNKYVMNVITYVEKIGGAKLLHGNLCLLLSSAEIILKGDDANCMCRQKGIYNNV